MCTILWIFLLHVLFLHISLIWMDMCILYEVAVDLITVHFCLLTFLLTEKSYRAR